MKATNETIQLGKSGKHPIHVPEGSVAMIAETNLPHKLFRRTVFSILILPISKFNDPKNPTKEEFRRRFGNGYKIRNGLYKGAVGNALKSNNSVK